MSDRPDPVHNADERMNGSALQLPESMNSGWVIGPPSRTRGEPDDPKAMRLWRLNGLALAAVLGAGGCGHDTVQASPDSALHASGLPEKVADYQRDPEPALRRSEVREIGNGQGAAPLGACDGSEELLARAEQGHGTVRSDVGWYGRGGNDVGVARFDWSDDTTFSYYADGFMRNSICLDGEADQTVELSGSTVPVWTPFKGPDGATVGANLLITLDGTILRVTCDWGDVADCRTFATELLRALHVS